MAFRPPQGNKTVMVDNSNNIVYPASFQKVVAIQATIAGNNFTDVPSVIDPENATTTQLPSVASVVSYVSDVVEGGSSGLIPAIQSDIQTLGKVKSNRGEFWFQGGSLACANKWTNSPFSLALTFSMTPEEYDLNALNATSDYQWLGTAVYGGNQKGFCLSLDVIGGDPRCVCIFFGATRTTTFAVENFKGKYCDGKPHSLFAILNSTAAIVRIDDDIYSANAPDYDDGTNTKPFSIFKNTARFSRIKYFNFDMSSDDAPYKIADYISGKDESPLLSGTLLSLDDYSIKVGATQIVPDVSGNNNDATITGAVYGSKDKSIAKMAQLFYQSQQG